MNVQDQFAAAKQQGYSDEEIFSFLESRPQFQEKIFQARQAGYSDQDILTHMSGKPALEPQMPAQQEPGTLEQIGRVGAQYALGAAEIAAMPYDIAVAPLASEQAQLSAFRQNLSADLERLMEQKAAGIWDDQDQALFDNIVDQIKNPRKSEQYVQTADIGIQGLFEKALNLDMKPEGFLEKGARWTGWIKNPKNLSDLAKAGMSKSQLAKAVMPTAPEAFRGAAAGAALQMAEDGDLGPIGTLAAAVAADATAIGTTQAVKAGTRFLAAPKKEAAKAVAATFAKGEQAELKKQIIEDFRKSGIQADLGTITDSNLVRMIQTKLGQSGLTGKPLEQLRRNITEEVLAEYKGLADGLGEAKYLNNFEAGQAAQETVTQLRNKDLQDVRTIYQNADQALGKDARVFTDKLVNNLNDLINKVSPGAIKSGEQKAVLDAAQKLKSDLLRTHPEGRTGAVKDLINNKIALNDIINYEVQGGAKNLLKGVVGDLDRAIISHGSQNPKFGRLYVNAQQRFATHAKTYRTRNIDQILRAQDPAQAMAKMNNIQGIRDLEKALSVTGEGKQLFNDLKRYKLDQIVGNSMVDSTTKQLKFGTFSKILEKGKNAEIVKELLGKKDFQRLQRLQKNSGKLAESINKFLNTSQSATTAIDAAALLKLVKDTGHLLSGNPWPLVKSGSMAVATNHLSKVLADPEFLKLVEEAILHSTAGNTKRANLAIEKLLPYAKLGRDKMVEPST